MAYLLICLFILCISSIYLFYVFPKRQEGVVRFYVGIRVCDASTPRPHPVSRQSSSPVDPAKYPARAARQWITRQSCSPVDPAQKPAIRAVHPAEYPAIKYQTALFGPNVGEHHSPNKKCKFLTPAAVSGTVQGSALLGALENSAKQGFGTPKPCSAPCLDG